MKQIGCLILATALLVGCSPHGADVFVEQHRGFSGGTGIEVDGTKYTVFLDSDIDQQGRVALSSLMVSLQDEQIRSTSNYNTRRGTTIVQIHVGGQTVVAKTDTLYFVQGERIIFEKEYQELGIDAQRLNADLDDIRDYLRPILEPLIREHIQPQEPDTE